MAKKHPQIEHVVWNDSTEFTGWQDPRRQDYSGLKCQTVGWVVDESDKHLALAGSIAPNATSTATGVMVIPKSAIVKRRKVR